MKIKKIIVQNIDDSISLYEKNIMIKNYKPNYDLKQSYEYFDYITQLSLKKIKSFRKNNKFWSGQSLILQPLFWYVSFNITKYKLFFDEYGFNIPSIDLKDDVRNSYKRAVLFHQNSSFMIRLIANLKSIKSYFLMILWIIINFIKNKKNNIWIDKYILTNYRYNHPDLKKIIYNSNYIEVLNFFSSPKSFKFKNNGFFDGLEKEIIKRIAGVNLWSIAIKLLKPKKIIVRDDLGPSQGILLAAKLYNIQIIGINHGVLSQWQSYMFGNRDFCILNSVVFDKIYVLHSSFLKLFYKKNTLYSSNQIKHSGWLQKFNYDIKQNNNNNNNIYVLYPFEHHTDFFSIEKLLLKFINLGKKVIVKKYPGWTNYKMFENMNIQLVDDFSVDHLHNAFVVVALTTTMVFEFIAKNFLVIYPNNSGYNLFEELEIPGLISDEEFFNNNQKKYSFDFKLEEITDDFKKEFI